MLERAQAVVLAQMREQIEAEGFTEIRPVHGCVFRFVSAEGTRLTEMAEMSGLTKQAVGEVVTELEAMGYVVRAPDPRDGRAKLVLLTAKGQRAQRAARMAFAGIEAGWADRFGPERAATLRELLEAIAAGA